MRQNMGMMPSSAREIARSPDACDTAKLAAILADQPNQSPQLRCSLMYAREEAQHSGSRRFAATLLLRRGGGGTCTARGPDTIPFTPAG